MKDVTFTADIINIKNGKLYKMCLLPAIECTNGQEGIAKVLYTDGEKLFVRKTEEFYKKFVPATAQEILMKELELKMTFPEDRVYKDILKLTDEEIENVKQER